MSETQTRTRTETEDTTRTDSRTRTETDRGGEQASAPMWIWGTTAFLAGYMVLRVAQTGGMV